ncbi:DUF2927 domain-containing protein [Aquimarina agarilytica]|uniref:DUF2927 domain-containing protein n=1 Tax=Aquimarina agarilytica TaxID=1087449 RepID=UPI000289BB95|nr:DUF2927 domain-containing protein [Aquimarina agarilytica]
MKLKCILGVLMISLSLSCSKERDTESVNTKPISIDQSFLIKEELSENDVIGVVVASDNEGDTLNYELVEKNTPFAVDAITGEIKLISAVANEVKYDLTVKVSDGDLSTTIEIAIEVTFPSKKKEIATADNRLIDVFKFLAFKQERKSPNKYISKWNDEISFFLSGDFKVNDVKLIEEFLNELTGFSSELKLKLVSSIDASNVEVYFSSIDDYKNDRPNYIENFIPNEKGSGIASTFSDGKAKSITKGKIWLRVNNGVVRKSTVKHEILHILGLGHSKDENSVLFTPSRAESLSADDIFVIKTLYNPLILPKQTESEVDQVLRNNRKSFFED